MITIYVLIDEISDSRRSKSIRIIIVNFLLRSEIALARRVPVNFVSPSLPKSETFDTVTIGIVVRSHRFIVLNHLILIVAKVTLDAERIIFIERVAIGKLYLKAFIVHFAHVDCRNVSGRNALELRYGLPVD